MSDSAAEIQRSYYARTAASYDAMHAAVDGGHSWAITHLLNLIDRTESKTLLDVGTGTGRALKAIMERSPGIDARGIEPVRELIDLAVERHGVPVGAISVGSGDALEFPDNSFDIVCELGVLHHVADPARVVGEMLRVARRGIVISDHNRFGSGSPAARWIKLGLARAGLWGITYRALHGGKAYHLSDGDGLAYSYSVYDNLRQISGWADELQLLTPGGATGSWLHPLLTSPHVVVVAERTSSAEPTA